MLFLHHQAEWFSYHESYICFMETKNILKLELIID